MTLDSTDLVRAAWLAEESLLSPEVRTDGARSRALLSPDFFEIGQSGRRWRRDDIIAAVAESFAMEATLTEKEARLIDPDIVLLTYRLEFGGRTSRRSALWRHTGSLTCLFHQGTPIVD